MISRRSIIIFFGVSLCSAIVPYFFLSHQLGQTPILPAGSFNLADYYYDRMQEVKDGHPFLGNPFFLEHRDDMPPAFFLADWFATIPLFFGLSIMHTAIINLLIWSFLFLCAAHLLLRQFAMPEKLSTLGSVVVFFSVYEHIIRPVSMQEIYPFFLLFLISFMLWLREPQDRKKIYFAGIAAATTAYIYTYAWQIVIVAFLLVPIAFWFTDRKQHLAGFLKMFSIFVTVSAPLLVFTWAQIHNPYYFETLHRIGLVETHIPASAVVSSCVWIPAMFLLWFIVSRGNAMVNLRKREGVVFLFFVLTGTAMVAVTLSNILTGKDLELPQHIERFTIIWLILASLYSMFFFVRHRASRPFPLPHLVVGTLLVGLLFFGNVRYFIEYGPSVVLEKIDQKRERTVQGFAKPLAWLEQNVSEESVVWADPNAPLNSYITMMTKHYVLFSAGGAIHLVSNKEVEERYLVSHYFALTEADLEDDYWAYGGVGNAVHSWKTHNREVKVCRVLRLDRLGHPCGELTDRVSWKGKSYFTSLYDQYENEIRYNVISELKKYHVSYIIRDNETDRPEFLPEQIPGTKLVYSDGRFFIYFFVAPA